MNYCVMMRTAIVTALSLVAASAQAQAKPSRVLDRAMHAAGGESRLKEFRGLQWTGPRRSAHSRS